MKRILSRGFNSNTVIRETLVTMKIEDEKQASSLKDNHLVVLMFTCYIALKVKMYVETKQARWCCELKSFKYAEHNIAVPQGIMISY